MDKRLKRIINKIKDESLRKKVADFLENPTIKIEDKTFSGLPLDVSPAGLSRHHSYAGGFIEHVVASTEIALTLCKIVRKIYGGKVNQDYVVAGILLHDIFKPLTYVERENGSYAMSSLGERLDHLTLAVSELIRRGFPLEVVHIVGAHHGYQAGPIGPKTIEALICHIADLADSSLNGEVLRAARYLVTKIVGEEPPAQLTAKEAFEIVYAKSVEGEDGVRKVFEKIKRKKPQSRV